MTRVQILRAGYAALGLAFLALAGSTASGALLLAGLAIGFAASILLLFSDDDLPKWSGLVILVYYVLLVLSFLLSAPITFQSGGFYLDPLDSALATQVQYYLGLAFPLLLVASALTAAWERERPARWLLVAGATGFVLVAVLTVALQPPPGATAIETAQRARQQGSILVILGAIAALAGAGGALWSAARPEEYA